MRGERLEAFFVMRIKDYTDRRKFINSQVLLDIAKAIS
jgi:hypothetical protein